MGHRGLHGTALTPNICRRSGSRNRKGMLETCNLLGCCLSVLSEECSCWLSVCAASSVCCRSTAASSAEPSLTSTTKPDKDPGLGTVFLSSDPKDTPDLALPPLWAALHYPPRSLPAAGTVQEQQHLGSREGQFGVGGDGSELQRASGGTKAHSGGDGGELKEADPAHRAAVAGWEVLSSALFAPRAALQPHN